MDVVDAISDVSTDSNDRPLTDVVIKSIRVIEGAENVTTSATTTVAITDPAGTPDGGDPLANPVHIVLEVADFGTVKADLYPGVAPLTVAHIVSLIEDGFYDGLTIHRVDPGFVIQGGDPAGNGFGVDGQETIKGEFAANGVDNPLKNDRGVLAMARLADDYDSATSQFYINLADNDFLNGAYATFGKVTEGMDVVDAIAAVETDANERPLTTVVITSIRIAE
ncbi:MAG: peptidylprolyl isomerase [Clostridia bacterium]|nr:peptidylprolyl isomerase [Clostridia bacterium]